MEHDYPRNLMALPIFDQERIVAVLGLANKATDYNDMDVWQLTLLLMLMMPWSVSGLIEKVSASEKLYKS